MRAPGIWEEFREEALPRHVGVISSVLGRDVAVEVDWISLPDDPRAAESLGYDLEMLARALGGVDTHNPFVPDSARVDPARLAEGIDRIRLRSVARREDCRVVVDQGALLIDFHWSSGGRFSAREMEALLLDREGRGIAKQVEKPPPREARLFVEAYRYRLPALLRALEGALGRPIPLRIEWSSLAAIPDGTFRLLFLLGELAKALRAVAKTEPGIVAGPEQVHDRAEARAAERGGSVRFAAREIRVRGGSVATDPVVRLDADGVELVVFRDEGELRRFPGCRAREMEKAILSALDLVVGPLRRRVQAEDFPTAQAHLPNLLETCVRKCRHLDTRDRVEVNRVLSIHPIALTVDWESFLAPESEEDRLEILRTLETGPYNYNCDFGPLFKHLFASIEEAFRTDPEFPLRFVSRVREIRYEQIDDPADRQLVAVGSVLVLRQCLLGSGGELTYSSALTEKLRTVVAAMPEEAGGGPASAADISELLGGLRVTVDPMLGTGGEAEHRALVEGVLAPLLGTLRLLLGEPGYALALESQLDGVRIEQAATEEEQGCAREGAELVIRCRPEAGAEGGLPGDELMRAIDDAFALRNFVNISEIEREERDFWQRMLRERFHREVSLTVDWTGFLRDPECGGNMLYPLNVKEAGVARAIYALTGFMDDDHQIRAQAKEKIHRIHILAAPKAEAPDARLTDGTLEVRCHAERGLHGFFTIAELQEQLCTLLEDDRSARDAQKR